MKNFGSTDILMERLEDGKYKRPIMENDETVLGPEKIEETFGNIVDVYDFCTSRPDNYEYFSRRASKQNG